MRRLLLAIAVFSAASCSQPTSLLTSDGKPHYVRLPIDQLSADFIERTGFVRDHISDDEYAFGFITRDLARIDGAKDIIALDESSLSRSDFNPKTLETIVPAYPVSEEFEPYHNHRELSADLKRLANTYPEIASLHSAGDSEDGRELWYLRISDNIDIDENEPKLLYVANMHGNETAGRELMIYLARLLIEDFETDERVQKLVSNSEIFIMPSMNPDGFSSGSRFNANYKDLNRDFPDFTSDPTDTPVGREPETKALMALHRDHHFVIALNFHGGAVCFNMPWDTRANREGSRFGDDILMKEFGLEYASMNPTMYNSSRFENGLTYGYEWYEVDGGLQDWASYYRRSFHATVELSTTKYPNARYLPAIWEENRESMLRYLERGLEGVHIKVVDSESRLAVEPAEVSLASLGRSIRFDSGYVHRLAAIGEQSVEISAPGYAPVSIMVDAIEFNGEFVEVALEKQR